MTTHRYRTVSDALPRILADLEKSGSDVSSRNGRALELLNQQIILTEPWKREVLNLGRGANVYAQIAETCWVLSGRNDIEWLSAYLPRAKEFSDDGTTWRGGYGPRIRDWRLFNGDRVDQLAHVVETLKADPLSRRAVIAIYDPAQDIPAGKDVPCNDFLQFLSRDGYLHLTVTVRSNDVMWGWSGINAFEWSVLQEIVASLLGVKIGPLTFNIGSLHLYERHWNKARRIEDEGRWATHPDPVAFNPYGVITTMDEVDLLLDRWFVWEAMCRSGEATQELLDEWEEPLFRTWAAAIAYYWMRDENWLKSIQNTALAVAMAHTPASLLPEPVQRPSEPAGVAVAHTTGPALSEPVTRFYEYVSDLHAKKHASYGDSWKKRGETLSILANIARKVDRLGVGDEFDSSADTYIDLWVYLAKYLCWLSGEDAGPANVDPILEWSLTKTADRGSGALDDLENIVADLDDYMDGVDAYGTVRKQSFVRSMIRRVAPYARDLWLAENTDDYRGADVD